MTGTVILRAGDGGEGGGLLLSFFAPNVIAYGAMVFVLCKSLFEKRPIRSQRLCAVIHFLAKTTLGIYLAHPLVIKLTSGLPMPDSTLLTIILRIALVLTLTAAGAALLSKVPVIRKLVI